MIGVPKSAAMCPSATVAPPPGCRRPSEASAAGAAGAMRPAAPSAGVAAAPSVVPACSPLDTRARIDALSDRPSVATRLVRTSTSTQAPGGRAGLEVRTDGPMGI